MFIEANTTIVVIGAGKMGEAIIGGWIASSQTPASTLSARNIVAVEPDEQRRLYLHDKYDIACVAQVSEITKADIVVLAVKPQIMDRVLEDIAALSLFGNDAIGATRAEAAASPLFISIAAGIATSSIEGKLAAGTHVIRVMPNLALLVFEGATAICGGTCATEEDISLVCSLFGCLGKAVVVAEDQMDAVCAVSGSGPAYVAAFVSYLRDGGVQEGLDAQLAETLALQTVLGTATLINETEQTPEAIRQATSSPGGTTLAAMDVMDKAGFKEMIEAGVAAAVKRAEELSQC